MKTSELQRLTVKELHNQAEKLGIKDFSGLKKQELIKTKPFWGMGGVEQPRHGFENPPKPDMTRRVLTGQ